MYLLRKCLMENSDLIATVGQAMVKIMVKTLTSIEQ